MVWILYSAPIPIADCEQTWEPEGVAASSFQAYYRRAQSKIERSYCPIVASSRNCLGVADNFRLWVKVVVDATGRKPNVESH